MPRRNRLDPDGGVHHVMNRGARHYNIYLDDRDRHLFMRYLADALSRNGIRVIAYCLMGNHFHLLLYCPEGGLPDTMQHLSSRYTRAFNRAHGFDGPLLRGRYVSKVVDTEAYVAIATRYIHRNPFDIGHEFETYRWSSHLAYCGLRPIPKWLDCQPVLASVGGPRGYKALIGGRLEQDQLLAQIGPEWTPIDLSRVNRACRFGSLDEITIVAAALFGSDPSDVQRRAKNCRLATHLALLLSADHAALQPAEVATYFGYSSPRTLMAAVGRARQVMKRDVRLRSARHLAEAKSKTNAPLRRAS